MSTDRELPFEKDDSRLRILYLYQMLQKRTNEKHPLSTYQIIEKMEAEHGIKMHRTTLTRDIAILRAAGFNVASFQKRALYYYLVKGKRGRPKTKPDPEAINASDAC